MTPDRKSEIKAAVQAVEQRFQAAVRAAEIARIEALRPVMDELLADVLDASPVAGEPTVPAPTTEATPSPKAQMAAVAKPTTPPPAAQTSQPTVGQEPAPDEDPFAAPKAGAKAPKTPKVSPAPVTGSMF